MSNGARIALGVACFVALAIAACVLLVVSSGILGTGEPGCHLLDHTLCDVTPQWTDTALGEEVGGGLNVRLDRAEYVDARQGLPAPPAGSVYLVLSVEVRNTYWGGTKRSRNPDGTMGPMEPAGHPLRFYPEKFSAAAGSGAALPLVDPPPADGWRGAQQVTEPVRVELVFVVPAGEAAVAVRYTVSDARGGYAWSLPGPAAGTPVVAGPTPYPTRPPRPTARPLPTPTQVPATPAAVGDSVALDDLTVTLRSAGYADAAAALAPPPPGTAWLVLDLELRTLGDFMVPHRTAWLTASDEGGRALEVAVPAEGGLEDGGLRAATPGVPAILAGRIAVAVPVGAGEVTVRYLAFAGIWGAASWMFPGPSLATPGA